MALAPRTIVFAPDSFKGSITAADAASALAEGWESERPEDDLVLRPVADGGEGTLDAFAAAVEGARRMPIVVTGPDGEWTDAAWLLLPGTHDAPEGTGVVELASTSGIELLGDRRLPWDAGTTGFGQAVAAALDHGVSRLVLGIGSSASTDGGAGLLTALGAELTDCAARPIAPGARGLPVVAHADFDRLRPLPPGGAVVLTDVTNPLLGPLGAAAVFGPQKGLAPEEIAEVEQGLARLAGLLPAEAKTPEPGPPEGRDSRSSRGARLLCPVPRRWPHSSAFARRSPAHPSSSPARAPSTANPPPARRPPTSPHSLPTRGFPSPSPQAGSHRMPIPPPSRVRRHSRPWRAPLRQPSPSRRAGSARPVRPSPVPSSACASARASRPGAQTPPSASVTTARASSCTSARCSGPRSDSAYSL